MTNEEIRALYMHDFSPDEPLERSAAWWAETIHQVHELRSAPTFQAAFALFQMFERGSWRRFANMGNSDAVRRIRAWSAWPTRQLQLGDLL